MTDKQTVYLREPSSELLFRFIYIDRGNIPVEIKCWPVSSVSLY